MGNQISTMIITPSKLPDAVIDKAYNVKLEVTGGTGAFRFSIRTGELPRGLKLNPSTGELTGIPTTLGTFRFMVMALGANGVGTTQAYSLLVFPRAAPGLDIFSAAGFGATSAPESIAIAKAGGGAVLAPVVDVKVGFQSAQFISVSANTVYFQVPPGTAPGLYLVIVFSASGGLFFGKIAVLPVAPGLFSAEDAANGLALGVIKRVNASGTESIEPIAVFDPTQNKIVPVPIDLGPDTDTVSLRLYGTGIRYGSSFSAKIEQVNAYVLYAGLPNYPIPDENLMPFAGHRDVLYLPGLDQVDLLMSRDLIGKGAVDVALTVDGNQANLVNITIT